MATVRDLITRWGFNVDFAKLEKMDREVGKIRRSTGRVGKELNKLATEARGFGLRMTAFATLPIAFLSGKMISLASDAVETENKFKEVFKGITVQANSAVASLSKDFDLATSTSQELLASTGDILTGFDFSRQEALKLSKQVQELSGDLASFKNVQGGTARASGIITKALIGERESLEALGTKVLEEDVKMKVAQLRMKGMTFATMRQAKAYATLQLIIDRNKDAIGDYARTQKEFANQQRAYQQQVKGLSETYGKILLPIATKVLGKVSQITAFFQGLSESTKKYLLIAAGVVAVLGPLVFIFGLMAGSLVSLIKLYKLYTVALAAAKAGQLAFNIQALLIPAALLAIVAALALIAEDVYTYFQGGNSVLGKPIKAFTDFVGGKIDWIKNQFSELWKNLGRGANAAIEKIKQPFKAIESTISGWFQSFGVKVGISAPTRSPGADLARSSTINNARSSQTNVNNNFDISMTVPEGTTDEQARFLERSANQSMERAFNEMFGAEIRKAALNN